MNTLQVIVEVDFGIDPDERYSKAWKRLAGARLERLLDVPEPILAAGSVLELSLDGRARELRVEALRWNAAKQMLRVRTRPAAALAASLEAQGIRAWRPWVARRCANEFLQRCRATGWQLAGAEEPRPAKAPAKPVAERSAAERASGDHDRKEPTL